MSRSHHRHYNALTALALTGTLANTFAWTGGTILINANGTIWGANGQAIVTSGTTVTSVAASANAYGSRIYGVIAANGAKPLVGVHSDDGSGSTDAYVWQATAGTGSGWNWQSGFYSAWGVLIGATLYAGQAATNATIKTIDTTAASPATPAALTLTGSATNFWSATGTGAFTPAALAPNGTTVWVGDGNTINKITTVTTAATLTNYATSLGTVYSLVVDTSGNCWFLSNPSFGSTSVSLSKMTPSGVITSYGGAWSGTLLSSSYIGIEALSIGPDGNLYVAYYDNGDAKNHVVILSTAGTLLANYAFTTASVNTNFFGGVWSNEGALWVAGNSGTQQLAKIT